MTTFVEINGKRYPADVTNAAPKRLFGGSDSKIIKAVMTHEEASRLFVNDAAWSIVVENARVRVTEDEQGNRTSETITEEDRTDCGEYCIAGDIVDHRDGTITVKMSKLSEAEIIAVLLGEEE